MLRRVALACAVALAALPATAQPLKPLAFTILRDGKPIGGNTVTFRQAPGGLEVEVRTDIVVKLAGIPLYRFRHEGHELWREDRLVSLRTATNDNGTRHAVEAEAQGEVLEVRGDAYRGPAPAEVVPASLWHPATPRQTVLLDPGDGTLMRVSGTDLGDETLTVRGRPVAARHWRLAGDLKRDLWYDAEGTLLRVRLVGRDGSEILWVPD